MRGPSSGIFVTHLQKLQLSFSQRPANRQDNFMGDEQKPCPIKSHLLYVLENGPENFLKKYMSGKIDGAPGGSRQIG
jgi:hypothetical protein